GRRGPYQLGGPLIMADGLHQQQPQAVGLVAGGDELALELDELADRLAGGFQILFEARILPARIEVVEIPLRQRLDWSGEGDGGRCHGGDMNLRGRGINARGGGWRRRPRPRPPTEAPRPQP